MKKIKKTTTTTTTKSKKHWQVNLASKISRPVRRIAAELADAAPKDLEQALAEMEQV